jgi:DNA phosphorothioation-dependent restriction protein DptG
VSESTASEHLNRLVELTVLLEFNNEGTTTYTSDPIYQRFQVVRELLDEYDQDGLLNLKEDLHARIETWQDEYGVNSPEDLRDIATETDSTEQATEIRRTAAQLGLTKYRLDIIEDVIDNYDTYTAHQAPV